MGKKSSKSPDVVGAAREEGEIARETARDTTYADRPDQYNPWGNITWNTESVIDPATGEKTTKWTQNQQLNEGAQDLYDKTEGMMRGRMGLAGGMMGRVANEMGGAPDWDQFGDVVGFDPAQARQHAEDAAYQKSVARLDPQFQRLQEKTEVDLRNRGLRPGDAAYDRAMSGFSTGRNDAYEQARLGSVAEGRDEFGIGLQGNERANALRKQQIEEYAAKRGYSLAEMNALAEGQDAGALSEMINGGGA